jgi:protein phosphatase
MSQQRTMPLQVVGRTDVGRKRQRNEDSLRWLMPDPGSQEARFGALFVVCDGMGGVGKGDIASQAAIEFIFKVFYDPQNTEMDLQKRLKGAIQAGHEAVRQKAAELNMMYIGTTAAGFAIDAQGNSVIFSLGDSRVYRLRDRKLTQVSKDQSVLAAQLEAGEITPEEAREARNMNITAFIGHPFELVVEMASVSFQPGDLMLMCSDGLWDIVHDEELEEILNRSNAEQAVDEFINTTLKRGAPDNVTAIVVSQRREKKASKLGWLLPLIILIILGSVVAGLFASGVIGLPNNPATETSEPSDSPPETLVSLVVTENPSERASVALLPSDTATVTNTPRPSATASRTPTETDTAEPTAIDTETPTATNSATRKPSRTPTDRPSATATATASATETPTPTRTVSPTRTPTSTASNTATATVTSSITPTATPSPEPSATDTPAPTATATSLPTDTATPRPTNTATAPPTTTLNPTALVNLGTPAAALEMVDILPFSIPLNSASSITPVAVYRGDIEILAGRVRSNPNDLGSRLQLVRIREGVRGDGVFWWLLEDVEPSLMVLNPEGILVRGAPNFSASEIGAIAVGERIRVIGIDPARRWYAIRGTRFVTGWVSTTLERDGLVRFEGDPAEVQVILPPRPTPDGTAGTPDADETPPGPEASPEAPPPTPAG